MEQTYRLNLALTLIVVFGALDAANTLILLQCGFYEVNPIMAWTLTFSTATFVVVKTAMTLVGAVILYWTRATTVASMLAAAYALLVMYQLHALQGCL